MKRSGFKRKSSWRNFRPGAIKAKRPNKMNARRCFDPVHGAFDSGDEAEYFQELLLRKQAGEIVSEIQRQIKFPLLVNGVKIGAIYPDFQYLEKGADKPTIDEFKGFDTPLWRWKWKHLVTQHKGEYNFVVSRKRTKRLDKAIED